MWTNRHKPNSNRPNTNFIELEDGSSVSTGIKTPATGFKIISDGSHNKTGIQNFAEGFKLFKRGSNIDFGFKIYDSGFKRLIESPNIYLGIKTYGDGTKSVVLGTKTFLGVQIFTKEGIRGLAGSSPIYLGVTPKSKGQKIASYGNNVYFGIRPFSSGFKMFIESSFASLGSVVFSDGFKQSIQSEKVLLGTMQDGSGFKKLLADTQIPLGINIATGEMIVRDGSSYVTAGINISDKTFKRIFGSSNIYLGITEDFIVHRDGSSITLGIKLQSESIGVLGQEVNLEAIPNIGREFIIWSDNVQKEEEKESYIYMDKHHVVDAFFEIVDLELNINIVRGIGSVRLIPEKEYYHYGDKVQIDIELEDDYNIADWYGDIDPEYDEPLLNKDSIEITMGTEDRNIDVELYQGKELRIEVLSDSGRVTPEPGTHTYRDNKWVELNAEEYDHPFIKWYSDSSADEAAVRNNYDKNTEIKMDDDRYIKAIFDDAALGFNHIDPGDVFKASPGETIEIDASAYYTWGSDDKIEYDIEIPDQLEETGDVEINWRKDDDGVEYPVILWTPYDPGSM